MLLQCIENVRDKLKAGKMYECIQVTSLGDLLIKEDDSSTSNYYKNDYFDISKLDYSEIPYKKVSI